MLEYLDQLDKQLLLALNNDYSLFWDTLIFTISQKLTWVPFYISIIYVVIARWKKQSWIVILGLVLSIFLADQIASGVLKNWVERPRPTHSDIAQYVVTVNGYKAGMYGFVSSHASNSFDLMLLTSLLFRRRLYLFSALIWAVVNSYSRIYLGVHYVGDILGGMLVGLLVAFFVFYLLRKIKRIKNHISQKSEKEKLFYIPIITLALSFIAVFIYSGIVAFG